jgi:hypothetical protein
MSEMESLVQMIRSAQQPQQPQPQQQLLPAQAQVRRPVFNVAALPQPKTLVNAVPGGNPSYNELAPGRGQPTAPAPVRPTTPTTPPAPVTTSPVAPPPGATPPPAAGVSPPIPQGQNFANVDDFNKVYGPGAGTMRGLLGFQNSQNNVDLLSQYRTGDNEGGYNFDQAKLQPFMDQGYLSQGSNGLGGEQAGLQYNLNYDKMPQTKFGSAAKVSAYDPKSKLFNPNLKYYDPNYGWITPTANVDVRGSPLEELGYNLGPALAMMAMTAGAGIGGLGGMMLKAPGYIEQLSNGTFNPGSLVGSAVQQGNNILGGP